MPPGAVVADMDEYEATFAIESRSDAYMVERLMHRVYDSLREESRTVSRGTGDSAAMLEGFEAIRDATRNRTPGELTVRYEARDDRFEG